MGKKIYTKDDIKILDDSSDEYDSVDISHDAFENNLNMAVNKAVTFAKTLVTNVLPDKVKYVMNLRASHNEVASEDQLPIDNIELYDLNNVFNLIWKDGTVPEWVNVYVESEDGEYTIIKIDCCSRYTSDKSQIYHVHEGIAPFHVLGPPIPPEADILKNEKYKI